MLSRGNKPDKPDKLFKIEYCDNEEFLQSNLLNIAFQIYNYYESCSKTEKVIREIVNDAKQCYLEGEEE